MRWLGIIFLVGLLLFTPFGLGRKLRRLAGPASLCAEVTVEKIKSLSKAQLIEMLRRVKTSEPPEPKLGAMCYETIAVFQKVEYICPHCGEKTTFPKNEESVAYEIKALDSAKREFFILKKLTPLKMKLEENGFCRHCRSGSKPKGLTLFVTYEDGTVHEAFPVDVNDMKKLKALLSGKLLWDSGNDGQSLLSEEISRLQELLGVSLDNQ